jgi:hypothetical protein
MEKLIKRTLNKFRGVNFFDASLEEDIYVIELSSECRNVTAVIAACGNDYGANMSILSSLEEEVMTYMITIEESDLEGYLNFLKETLKERPHIRENLTKIPKFKELNLESKRKYRNYIKFLRIIGINGFSDLSAEQLIDMGRFCGGCGKELYTQDDQMRTILEFDDPRRVLEILDKIRDSHSDEK